MSRLTEPRRLLSRSPKDSSLLVALTAARARQPRAGELQALAESLRGVMENEPAQPNTIEMPPPSSPVETAPDAVSRSGGSLALKVGTLMVTLGMLVGGVSWSVQHTHRGTAAASSAVTRLPARPPSERPPQAVRSEPAAATSNLADRASECANAPCARRNAQAPRAGRRVDPQAPIAVASSSLRAADATLSELQLIDEAREALQSSPTRALALANQHEQQFPHGSMAEERNVIRISALVALGQTSRARALATAFLRANRGSAYARRVEEALSASP